MQMLLITDNTDAMIGMRLAGIEAVRVKNVEEAQTQIQKAASNENIGIILLTANVEKMCGETLLRLKQEKRPLVAVIPDSDGNGRNENAITDYIRDAIGIKI